VCRRKVNIMTMLHGLKKTAFKVSAHKEPENAEFADYKQRIANVVKALTESSSQLDKAEKQWHTLFTEQKKQAENFANLYPDNDELRKVAKQAVEITDAMQSQSVSTSPLSSQYSTIAGKVKTYLAEYKTLESEYARLANAKTESELYRKKVDDLEKAKKQDEEKMSRNLAKYDDAHTTYERQLEGVIARQKQFYGKRKEVFKAAFVAYWLAHGTYASLLSGKVGPLSDYVQANEQNMLTLDVANLKVTE